MHITEECPAFCSPHLCGAAKAVLFRAASILGPSSSCALVLAMLCSILHKGHSLRKATCLTRKTDGLGGQEPTERLPM
jgi:hypothetical protein